MSNGGWDDFSDIGRLATMLACGALGCVLVVLLIIAGLLYWVWSLLQ